MTHFNSVRLRTAVPMRLSGLAAATHGSMLIDLLVGCVIALLTGAVLVSLQQSSYIAQLTIQGQNYANTSSRRPLDVLGDTLRNAQSNGSGSSAAALVAASGSDVTCYTDDSGDTTRIWLDTSAQVLRRSRSGSGASGGSGPSAGTASSGGGSGTGAGGSGGSSSEPLVTDMQSLQITYYVPAGGAYNADVSGWVTTADPHAPSASELPLVGAVNIVATVSLNGETRTLQSFVRLRNSPPPPTS